MLTEKQLKDIKELQNVCERAESIQLKLNWDMLKSSSWEIENSFLFYENQKLIGFLAVYPFGNKAELCGMVHPAYRRRGIFTSGMEEALKQIKGSYRKVLLNAPPDSASAKAFLKNVSCEYDSTEYQMQWQPMELADDEGVTVRLSQTEDDFQKEVALDVQCFGFTNEEAIEYNERIKEDPAQIFYMIDWQETTVGKIRVSHIDKAAWIYGFSVFPEWQGRGFGRKALNQLTKRKFEKGYQVFLEVDADNSNALKLYQSCGYETVQAQDYYLYKWK